MILAILDGAKDVGTVQVMHNGVARMTRWTPFIEPTPSPKSDLINCALYLSKETAAQSAVSNGYTITKVETPARQPFNEADCGGVFDGFTVTSDADPGL